MKDVLKKVRDMDPMPLLTHGGPGRAGGGEEMGGVRGIKHYLQRTAVQGHPETITRITEQFQVGGNQPKLHHTFLENILKSFK